MAPNWPVEYGGTGWTLTQKYIAAREFASCQRTPAHVWHHYARAGIDCLWQRRAERPVTCREFSRAEDVWCQGYSEPGAGSDLARLKTRAVREGDHYVDQWPEALDQLCALG